MLPWWSVDNTLVGSICFCLCCILLNFAYLSFSLTLNFSNNLARCYRSCSRFVICASYLLVILCGYLIGLIGLAPFAAILVNDLFVFNRLWISLTPYPSWWSLDALSTFSLTRLFDFVLSLCFMSFYSPYWYSLLKNYLVRFFL